MYQIFRGSSGSPVHNAQLPYDWKGSNLMVVLWIMIALAALIAAYFLFLTVCGLFVDVNKEYDRNSPFYRFLINSATAMAMVLVRIRVEVRGMDKLPEGRFLFISNHSSKFDPILCWYIFRRQDLAFISKPENFKVPFFGKIIRRCCFMPIDRENPRNAIKTINRAAELLKKDEVSVAVYPEGTRNYGKELLPFHNGVLKIAQKAQVPLVIAAVRGTEDIHKNYPLRRSRVEIEILDVLDAEQVKKMRTSEMGDLACALIRDALA